MNLNLQNKDILRVDYVQQNPVSKYSPVTVKEGSPTASNLYKFQARKISQALQYKNPRCAEVAA